MLKLVTEKSGRHQRVFDEMIKRYNLSIPDLSKKSGIDEWTIYRFRSGKTDLAVSDWVTLLLSVSPEALTWYLLMLFFINLGPTERA